MRDDADTQNVPRSSSVSCAPGEQHDAAHRAVATRSRDRAAGDSPSHSRAYSTADTTVTSSCPAASRSFSSDGVPVTSSASLHDAPVDRAVDRIAVDVRDPAEAHGCKASVARFRRQRFHVRKPERWRSCSCPARTHQSHATSLAEPDADTDCPGSASSPRTSASRCRASPVRPAASRAANEAHDLAVRHHHRRVGARLRDRSSRRPRCPRDRSRRNPARSATGTA